MLEASPEAVPVSTVVTHTHNFALAASGLVISVFTQSNTVYTAPSQGHTAICIYRAAPSNEKVNVTWLKQGVVKPHSD